VRGRELNAELAKSGLAFPVGHCPTVPLSGFLLNGGLGWNFGGWGPACFSIESANVVTADGKLVVTSDTHQSDLLWAIRGAGPGFFGVITQYRLKTYPVPRTITGCDYFYPLEHIDAVGDWAASIATKMPKEVELTLFCAAAPPPLAQRAKSSNGYVALLNATVFVGTQAEAAAALAPLEGSPASLGLLKKDAGQPMTMNGLLDLGGELWPEHHRYLADTLWTNTPPDQPLTILGDRFLHAPSPISLGLCVFATGRERTALPDAAFSMTAKNIILCYAIWERPQDDAANRDWHRELVAALDPFAVGHYVGESDIVSHPARAEKSFAPTNWQHLQALRQTYDPSGLFWGAFGAS
jgi:FAD/FMN-containing dehydrogenase